jgi:hypothetical protein
VGSDDLQPVSALELSPEARHPPGLASGAADVVEGQEAMWKDAVPLEVALHPEEPMIGVDHDQIDRPQRLSPPQKPLGVRVAPEDPGLLGEVDR